MQASAPTALPPQFLPGRDVQCGAGQDLHGGCLGLAEAALFGKALGLQVACPHPHIQAAAAIALGQLLSEQGDNLELFADRREDEARLINFLAELDKENENA